MFNIGKWLDKRLGNQQLQVKLNASGLVLPLIFEYLSFYYNSNFKVVTCAVDTHTLLVPFLT